MDSYFLINAIPTIIIAFARSSLIGVEPSLNIELHKYRDVSE